MIDTRAVGEELQDLQHQIVDRIRKSQETVTDAIKTWTQTVQSVRPQIPALPMPTLTGKLPSPEALTAMLPKPETLVAGAYDLAEQFIAIQRKLAEQMVHAAMPLTRQGAAMFGLSPAKPATRTASTGHKTAQAATATAKSGTSHTGTSHTGSSHTGSSHTGSSQTGTAKKGTSQTGTAKTSTSQTDSSRTGAATAKTETAKTGTAAKNARSTK